MLRQIGDIAFLVAGSGILAFTVLFLGLVRWWTDALGRLIALVMLSEALIITLALVRLFGVPLPGLYWWRAFLFGTLGVGLWTGCVLFVWAQFIAPRRRKPRKLEREEDGDF